jgi:predicted dehydrogenase
MPYSAAEPLTVGRSECVAEQQIRLGVVGLGVMGARMLGHALRHPDFVVARAADNNPGAIDRAALDVPVTAAADLVTADDVDAVYIATPPATHADLAVAAMRSGKAVLCEKPLAVSMDDGTRMRDVAADTGVATGVNFPFSDFAATRHLAESLRSGELGEVLGVDIQLTFPEWPRRFQATATWVGEREQGGFIREVFSHFAYLTDRLLGPIQATDVGVTLPSDPNTSEVAARGLLHCNDIPVTVSGRAGVAAPEHYEWIIWGTRRSFLLRNWASLSVSDGGDWSPVDLGEAVRGESTRLTLFADAIRGHRTDDLADFAAALRVQEAVEAFHQT